MKSKKKFNQNRLAHIIAHLSLGFAFAHLYLLSPQTVFLICLFILLVIIVISKEIIDETHNKTNRFISDVFQYLSGFTFFFIYIYIVKGIN